MVSFKCSYKWVNKKFLIQMRLRRTGRPCSGGGGGGRGAGNLWPEFVGKGEQLNLLFPISQITSSHRKRFAATWRRKAGDESKCIWLQREGTPFLCKFKTNLGLPSRLRARFICARLHAPRSTPSPTYF